MFSDAYNRIDAEQFTALMESMSTPGLINFGGGSIENAILPAEDLSGLAKAVLKEDGGRILQYDDGAGRADMLASFQKYLHDSRDIHAEKDRLMIVNGGTQGLFLICQLFLNPGDTVLVEAPTFLVIFMILQKLHVNCIGVKTDENGIVPEDLEKKIRKYDPKLLYVIPTFQNPSGRITSLERRMQIAEIADRYDLHVMEDDPYYDLVMDPRPGSRKPVAIYNLSKKDKVLFVNSFSKIISPGLRVGGVCAPPEVIRALCVLKQQVDMHTPGLTQALCSKYLESGMIESHIEQLVQANAQKLEVMISAVNAYFPAGTTYEVPRGGIFLWVELPEGYCADDRLEEAIRDYGIAYMPGSAFYPEAGCGSRQMRLNFAGMTPDMIEKGIQQLGALFRK